MLGKRIIYYILGAFIAGNLLLIYIQYNSTKNVNKLIDGNVQESSEFKVRSDLGELTHNITSIESKISGTLYTKDSSHLEGLGVKVKEIQHELDNLQKISDDDTSVKYIDVLDRLVHKKLLFGREVLDTLYISGRDAAEALTSSPEARGLNDSIRMVTRIIEISRQRLIGIVTATINKSGKRALSAGTALIVFVLLSGAVLFWFIITVIQKQNQLIIQLNDTDKKVREAARVKENFLANMSHEIRTPVNAILGFTGLLQQKNVDSETREYIQTIQKSSENLLAIINDILDLSKIEAGMMRIESAPFNIRKLLHSIELMFQPKMNEKKLRFFIDVDDTVPDILEGDGNRLTQILVNLIGNALKFTSKGTIAIKISAGAKDEDVLNTRISVSDTGIGIAKDKLRTIFERFHQAEDSVTRKYGGTGLGLSIANDLVLLQNGTLSVESDPGFGTTFTVEIPYKVSNATTNVPANAVLPLTDPPAFSNARILVVEDNEINQNLLKFLFRNWKLSFDLVNNGFEAIRQIQAIKYDLVLMDIQMPGMDGYTATTHIRNILKIHTPIIAMTAHAFAGEREKCLHYGMSEYISKPIRENELLLLLKKFIITGDGENDHTPGQFAAADPVYKYIDLHYMRDISRGNVEYEKTITAQFIEAIPVELKKMEDSWGHDDLPQLRQTAHNMKTTVSVMGLIDSLGSILDSLENDPLNKVTFQFKYTSLKFICNAALAEASHFYSSLEVPSYS